MTIKLEVSGIQYDNFTSASCEIRLDALTNTFSFEAVAADGLPLPFKGGEACRIIVNDNVVITGFIEVVDVSYDAGDHAVTVQGRDKTGDLLDSSLDAISDLRSPITLKEIIEKVISNIDSDIEVVDEVNPPAFEEAQDIVSPEPGENAFEFIEKYARKRQVLLTSDGDGNVVITDGNPDQVPGSIQHVIGANDNNVISSSFSFDTTGRYNLYKFASQLNPTALNIAGSIGLGSIANQSGGASDIDIRTGRQLILISEAPFSDDQNESRSKWEANIRKARGLVYSATVSGYGVDASDSTSDLWQINKLYQIIDDYLGKVEPMLCNSITFTLDINSGEQTQLSFVDEQAYTLELTKPRTSETASLII